MTILEAAAKLKAGASTSAGLVDQTLAAIAENDGRLNAFITVLDGPARARAKALDSELAQGKSRGPLHGVPVAVKDLFHMKGIRTTAGSKLFEDLVSTFDSSVTEKLEAAGAVIIGKTNLHELAYGVTSNNPHFGAVHNPHNLDCVPGGSSGGSGAAVGAGIVPMGMGTDTGGSIRIPAAFCGTVGLKPTFGRVSKFGCMPLGLSLDHMGPLTMTIRDTAVTMDAIAGHDPRDPNTSSRPVQSYLPSDNPSLAGVRIGWPVNFYFDRLDTEVRKSVENARMVAESLGAQIIEVRVPDIAALNTVSRVILMSEASAVLERFLGDRSKLSRRPGFTRSGKAVAGHRLRQCSAGPPRDAGRIREAVRYRGLSVHAGLPDFGPADRPENRDDRQRRGRRPPGRDPVCSRHQRVGASRALAAMWPYHEGTTHRSSDRRPRIC